MLGEFYQPLSYIPYMLYVILMREVNLEFVESWLDNLDQDSYEQVIAALELLIDRGPQLGRPLVDTVKA